MGSVERMLKTGHIDDGGEKWDGSSDRIPEKKVLRGCWKREYIDWMGEKPPYSM